MKQVFALLISALALLSGGCRAQDGFTSMDNREFAKAIETGGVQLVDVRTAGEFADGHIPGAINIDVKGDDFDMRAAELLDKEQTVAVYCRSGARSKTAAQHLVEKGFKVYELDKGFMNWDGPAEK
ncbi:MAG: rhodanese-like domain-containing protein [Bacteroidales bacterium]|nr:rhodanese-like domain-containing protein [Bacteroides sp.]MCM1502061.1 rhodanese-like domain-containing protein [Bacteroidales bacterium]